MATRPRIGVLPGESKVPRVASRVVAPTGTSGVLRSRPTVVQPSIVIDTSARGGAIISMEFPVAGALMAHIRPNDLTALRSLAQKMLMAMAALSQGPYSLVQLKAMGHPYAARRPVVKPKPTSKKTHNVPRFRPNQAIGHIAGIRGSVPTLSVTNRQSGKLAQSYRYDLTTGADRITLRLMNSAPYAGYLAQGTPRMIAHGPWTYVPNQYMAQLVSAMQAVLTDAWVRYGVAQVEEQAAQLARAGLRLA